MFIWFLTQKQINFKIIEDEELEVDLLIADEAHKLRNDTSKLNRLIETVKRKRTWLLTGTP